MSTVRQISRNSSLWLALLALVILGAVMLASGSLAHGSASTVTKVYWTDRNNATLSVTDVGSSVTEVLVTNTGGRLQDVDLDATTNILYFADWGKTGPFPDPNEGSISRVNTDGTGLGTVIGGGALPDAVHQLALDPANSRLYFSQGVSYTPYQVSRVDYSGAALTTLNSGLPFVDGGHFPSGLALDSANGLVYWADIGVLASDGVVNSMDLTGGSQTVLEPHVNGRGRGFAFDAASQTIFLTAHDQLNPGGGGGVFAYDIVNGILTTLITNPGTGYWDIEIDPTANRIWFTDFANNQILSADFDGSNVTVELSNLTNPYGLALEFSREIEVGVDVKPTSCPNPLNVKSKGVLPVAITGSDTLDVNDINVSTITLEGVSPIRSNVEDVATPHEPFVDKDLDRNNCTEEGADGLDDLTLKFDSQAIVVALGSVSDGDVVAVHLTGELNDGTPILGEDVVWIKKKGKK